MRNANLPPRRFTYTRFTGENGVVLAAAGEDIDNLADFFIASLIPHLFCRFGGVGKVNGEFIQGRGFAGGAGVGCAVIAAAGVAL